MRAKLVDEILEKWRRGTRGPLPQLTPIKVLEAFVIIEQEGPVGRRLLAQGLGINDGVARGLLERLSDEGLVSVDPNGATLSRKGRARLSGLLHEIGVKNIHRLETFEMVPQRQAVAVQIANALRPDVSGILQRDEAVRAGAEGAITFGVTHGRLVVPPDKKDVAELSPRDDARLRQAFSPSENDIIVIGFGENHYQALAGSLAAVFSLFPKT